MFLPVGHVLGSCVPDVSLRVVRFRLAQNLKLYVFLPKIPMARVQLISVEVLSLQCICSDLTAYRIIRVLVMYMYIKFNSRSLH